MTDAKTSESMSPELQKVVARAREHPEERILSLAHRIDVPALERAYPPTAERRGGGSRWGYKGGVRAGSGAQASGPARAAEVEEMAASADPSRTHPERTRARPADRYLDAWRTRSYRTPCVRCWKRSMSRTSWTARIGFRPGRGAHDALRALDRAVHQGRVQWIIEADIVSFFDSLDRTKLMEMLRSRVDDESLLRLVGKCLHVGVLDGEEYTEPETGHGTGVGALTASRQRLSALCVGPVVRARESSRVFRGRAYLIRYADDFVIALEDRTDAERVMAVLPKRMGRFGLTLHPDKTRLLPFGRPKKERREGSGHLRLSGVHACTGGGPVVVGGRCGARPSVRDSLERLRSIAEYCRSHRHDSVKTQHAALVRRLRGHFNYFRRKWQIGRASNTWWRRCVASGESGSETQPTEVESPGRGS